MHQKSVQRVAILCLLVSSVLLSGFFGFFFKRNVVASVDGEAITLEDLQTRIATYPPQYAQALKNKDNKVKVLDQLIDEQVLLVAAKKAGVQKKPEFKTQLKNAENQLLLNFYMKDKVEPKLTVSNEEIQQFYLKNPAQFQEVEQRRARHILVKTEPEAADLLKKVQAGANFAALAKEKSLDPSKDNGGDLGWFQKGQLVPEFERQVYSMKKGATAMVKTQFGYHVVKLEDVQVRPKMEFEKVRGQIRDALINEKKRVLLSNTLAELKKTYKIKKDVSKL